MNQTRFHDCREAGQRLAELLADAKDQNPVVLALPRGGVPVTGGGERARSPAGHPRGEKDRLPMAAGVGGRSHSRGGNRGTEPTAHRLIETLIQMQEVGRRLQSYRVVRPPVPLEGRSRTDLQIVTSATHPFEESGALERVAELAAGWFLRYFARLSRSSQRG